MAKFEVGVIFQVEGDSEQHVRNLINQLITNNSLFPYEIDLVLELEDDNG